MLLRSSLFEVELRRWSLYVRIGARSVFLCRGLSSIT
jgi:hypothetical protein